MTGGGSRAAEYQGALDELRAADGSPDPVAWESYAAQRSGLPGPRGNLELVGALADAGDEALFRRWLAADAVRRPAGESAELLTVAALVGPGRLAGQARFELLAELRTWADDRRWRVREAVAMGLQRVGDADLPTLLAEMRRWATGTALQQRAAVAALCEPRLLVDPDAVSTTLQLLDAVTASLLARPPAQRRSDQVRALRKALGYGWSVAVAAAPARGQPRFERWCTVPDTDVAWVMRENLRKARLHRACPEWTADWQRRLADAVASRDCPRNSSRNTSRNSEPV